ncbi:plasma membrane calcium [Fusarium oxysporum]|nr:plasma membrane calcium [Fusarium oxysporum]
MADHDDHPPMRRRAPTITIDTTAVNPNISTEPPQESHPSNMQDDAVSPTTIADPVSTSGMSQRPSRPELDTSMAFENRDSRPTSPHNVSSPVTSRSGERGVGFLSVPMNHRSRQNSVDSDDMSRSVSSQGDTTVVASNSTQTDTLKGSEYDHKKITNDESALKPDTGTEQDFEVENNPFAFTPGQMNKMFNPKSLSAFYMLGGIDGIEKGLRSDRKAGLSMDEKSLTGKISFEDATSKKQMPREDHPAAQTGDSFADRLRVFKDNRLPEKKGKSLLELMWITYNDKVLILLSIAAVVSLAVGLYQSFGQKHEEGEPKVEWVEGVAIIVAIAIVVIVGSLNDYQKERQFTKLNKKKQDRLVKVIRSGKTIELSVFDVLAGDVIHIEPGDLVPVDGVLIEGFNVKCDESQATGESDIIRKQASEVVYNAIENHDDLKKLDPFIQSGARIMEGVGTYMATSVGVYSSYGKTLMSLNEDPEMTPPTGEAECYRYLHR